MQHLWITSSCNINKYKATAVSLSVNKEQVSIVPQTIIRELLDFLWSPRNIRMVCTYIVALNFFVVHFN